MLTWELLPFSRLLTDGWYSSRISTSSACVWPLARTCSRMADKISALIFSALASDAEKPRASRMFPFAIWVGLFSAALFMCPLLLQSLLHPFQSLPGHLEVTSVRSEEHTSELQSPMYLV